MLQLSFVVPCYNVEKHLQACLDTLFSCGLSGTDFEILAIDDCSPDGSLSILRRNAEIHPELKIVSHPENKGLGGARNTGIRNANGKFLWFVDADDMIKGSMVEEAVRNCLCHELDILAFNFDKVDQDGDVKSKHLVFTEMPVLDGRNFASKAFRGGITGHMGYVWRFIYRTDFLRAQSLFFPEKTYWEDTVFMPEAILKAERVASISDVLYSYRVNPESISGTFSKVYPAKMIYDYAFYCGKELLRLSDEIQDCPCKKSIKECAINKFICGFAVYLLRTSKQERRVFYSMIDGREVNEVKPWMNRLSRLLVIPAIGPVIADFMSILYKMKRFRA